jgi:NAD(P)-dependent dehydrogenase (short-subunit alcohol dehydrogenase family)
MLVLCHVVVIIICCWCLSTPLFHRDCLSLFIRRQGAHVLVTCRKTNDILVGFGVQVLEGMHVTQIDTITKMCDEITKPVDIVVNNSGYFPNIHETVADSSNPLNFDEGLKQIDVCAMGPLRVTSTMFQKGKINAVRMTPATAHKLVFVQVNNRALHALKKLPSSPSSRGG